MNPLAEQVRAERLRRGWSVRDAASSGKISNTWWARFEDGQQPLTDGLTVAVATAYGWPSDWPAQPRPVVDVDALEALRAALEELAARVDAIQAQVAEGLAGAVRRAEIEAHQSDAPVPQSPGGVL